MRTLALDPGKKNSWWTLWRGKTLTKSGRLVTPETIAACADVSFQQSIEEWLIGLGLTKGDEVVIERYQHRPGSGGNVAEIMGAIIWNVAVVAARVGYVVVLVMPSTHKQSFKKWHTAMYPTRIIKRLGDRHGEWRPRAKRLDPCLHVMDAATLGCYRILKRDGRF